ncbi:MAG: dephospho-CoA kinase [Clostridia bacterium]|nr:dephospho-CoA kinase [Clostridia bacterium]
MKIIGLTGGIACGKTTVAGMLSKLGAVILDADAISRELTAPGGDALPAIREAFGSDVFLPDGTLNRAALAAQVFSDEDKLLTLNRITHPMILDRLAGGIATCRESGVPIVVLDVPLLFEVHADALADLTVCVTAPREVQIDRLYTRSGLSREQAIRRIESQMPVAQKAALSDVVLDTHKPLDELEQDVQKLYDTWMGNGPSGRKEIP